MTTDTKLTREQIELWRVVLGNRMGQADALCDMALRSLAAEQVPSDSVVEALRWVLPLAKGYADAHPVGSNQEYVDDAVAVLAQADAARIGQLERELAEASRRIEELEFGPWKVK